MKYSATTMAAMAAALALAAGALAADEKSGREGNVQGTSRMMPVPPNPKPPGPMTRDAQSVQVEKTLAPGKLHEECLDLEPGQRLRYEFDARARVDFNIHYHRGNEAVFPVKRDDVESDGGVFEPATRQHYCMMWSNPSKEPAALGYQFRVE